MGGNFTIQQRYRQLKVTGRISRSHELRNITPDLNNIPRCLIICKSVRQLIILQRKVKVFVASIIFIPCTVCDRPSVTKRIYKQVLQKIIISDNKYEVLVKNGEHGEFDQKPKEPASKSKTLQSKTKTARPASLSPQHCCSWWFQTQLGDTN